LIAVWSETGLARIVMFAAAWGVCEFLLAGLVAPAALSAALSMALLVTLIAVSRFKFDVLWMRQASSTS